MKRNDFGVSTLHKKGLIKHRQVFYKMIKETKSPGLDLIEGILFGMGLTWHDWAQAYAEVNKKEDALSKSGQAAIKDLKEALKNIEDMTSGKMESNAYIVYRNRSRAGVDKKTGLPKVLTEKEREKLIGK